MGGGSYSTARAMNTSVQYKSKSAHQIFESRFLHPEMDPRNTLRECCETEEHPLTVPILVGLDVTGSMGMIPTNFIQEGMTHIMGSLYETGLKDSQLLFCGIGDHKCDDAPFQVGQFEADDELLNKWLKNIYLESGGGGNGGESYLLAWYYAANCIQMDANKRGRKGFLFTIGDDATHMVLQDYAIAEIFGNRDCDSKTASELLKEAQEKFHVYHINVTCTSRGRSDITQGSWRELIGDNLILVEDHKDIPSIISDTIMEKSKFNCVQTEVPVKQRLDEAEEETPEVLL